MDRMEGHLPKLEIRAFNILNDPSMLQNIIRNAGYESLLENNFPLHAVV
jgi:hypothetical protein